MIFGHVTSTMVVVRLVEKKPRPLLYLVAVIGAYFPDFIDKGTTQLLSLGSDRGIGHSLFLNIPLWMLMWISIRRVDFFRRNQQFIKWFGFGVALHLLEDFLNPVILFWPFLGDFPPRLNISLLTMLESMYLKISHPHIFITEFIGHIAFAFLMIRDWYFTRRTIRQASGATEYGK